MHAQFMAWDTFSRRRIDLVGRQDDGDKVIAHEFDFSIPNQLIYSRNGVNITSTPVSHYQTDGPVALRLDWNGLSVTYSGGPHFSQKPSLFGLTKASHCLVAANKPVTVNAYAYMHTSNLSCKCSWLTVVLPALGALCTCAHAALMQA